MAQIANNTLVNFRGEYSIQPRRAREHWQTAGENPHVAEHENGA